MERALWEQGLRHPLAKGVRRHEWKATHGFRKYYKSHAEQVMKPINVEITMGHNIGLSESYYRPTQQEVLQDYLKAVDNLTIGVDKAVLQKQVDRIKQETKDNEYIIKGKLQEKDEEIRSTTKRPHMSLNWDQLETPIQAFYKKIDRRRKQLPVAINKLR